MRLVLVSPYDLGVPGGVQSHVARLASALRAEGDEVVVVGPGDGRAIDGGYAGTGRSVGIPFNGSVAPVGPGPVAFARTRGFLEEIRPDVVHVHEPLVPSVGLAAASWRGAPVVATFHAWSSEVRAYRLARPVGRRVLGGLAAAIAVSPAAAGYHARALDVPVDRFEVVPNGVDVARFADLPATPAETRGIAATPDAPRTSETLLFVGRLEPRKGLATLIRAVVLLKQRRPGVRLLVIGDGPERQRCRALLPEALHEDVRFLGRVTEQELVRSFATADLYVSPALGGESFGIVLLEAMAAGRPVVASDIPGYRSVVTPGEDGVLVTPADPTALMEAVDALLDDPRRCAALVEAGRRTAAAHDWSVIAGRLRGIYAKALRGH